MKYISKTIYIFLVIFTLSGCAKHNAGIVKQTFHDLTSHYNGYFNAKENYNINAKTLSKDRVENYDEILPLYAYGSIDEIKDKNGILSTTIAKARLTIQTHQEKVEGKNYQKNEDNSISNWSDDAFLLIGQSYYLQGQTDSAISCFRYITANFDVSVDGRSKKKIKKQKNNKKKKAKAKKKKKKLIVAEKEGKDIRPSDKAFVHESTKSEALVWLAKAYVSNKQYTEAEAVLTYIRADNTFLKNYDKDVELVNTFLYLEQGSTSNATGSLTTALEKIKKQKNKARLQFILAQLFEVEGYKTQAAEYYKKSMKSNANFEMVFYAKLKLIQMNRGENYNSKDTEKLIAKLIRDNKNKDYLDQLYYEKALIALEEEEREDAKKYLAKSIDKSTVNAKQKGISYVLLADMNYEEEAYSNAQAFYDSSLVLIDEEYVDYEKVSNRSVVLTELVSHLTTIKMNDSLLVLAQLSPKELESLLYKKAVDIVDQEIKNEEKNKQSLLTPSSSSSGKNDKNSWYFYSDASKSSGYKKFKQKWSDVELEDDWRRSDKTDNSFANDEEGSSDAEDEYFARIDAQYDAMLAAVPSSEIEKNDLNTAIIDAYYNAAVVYKVGLDNFPKSIEMFEALNKKFAKNEYEAEALYQLYILYTDENHKTKADVVKKELLSKYPNSTFAKYIKDPNSLKKQSNEQNVLDYYDNLFVKYEGEQFDLVIQECENIDNVFTLNPIKAKFDLLKAMAIGGKKEFDPFVASLEYVAETHANTEEQEKAELLLAYLRGEDPDLNNTGSESEGKLENSKLNKNKSPINLLPNSKELEKADVNDKNGVNFKLGKKEIKLGGKKGSSDLKKDE